MFQRLLQNAMYSATASEAQERIWPARFSRRSAVALAAIFCLRVVRTPEAFYIIGHEAA